MKHGAFLLTLVFAGLIIAGDSVSNDVVLRVTPSQTRMSLTAELYSTTATVQGWSFGLCHDPSKANILHVEAADELNFLLNGEPVGYLAYGVAEQGSVAGVFQGVVVGSVDPSSPTPPIAVGPYPEGLPTLHVQYEIFEESAVAFCHETLGEPPVGVHFVTGGLSYTPSATAGALLLAPSYEEELTFQVSPQQSDGVVTVQLVSPTAAIQGWSYGLCHWESKATVKEIAPAADLDVLRDGDPVDFLDCTIVPGETRAGVTQAVVIDVGAQSYGPFPQGIDLLHIRYEVATETDITFCDDTLGDVPVANVIVIRGAGYRPKTQRGGQLVVGTLAAQFIRGDATRDGRIDIGDGIRICLGVMGRAPLHCRDAADVDDNGRVDLADGIRLFMFLFAKGRPPASPFPEAGTDLTPSDDLGCEQ